MRLQERFGFVRLYQGRPVHTLVCLQLAFLLKAVPEVLSKGSCVDVVVPIVTSLHFYSTYYHLHWTENNDSKTGILQWKITKYTEKRYSSFYENCPT